MIDNTINDDKTIAGGEDMFLLGAITSLLGRRKV